LQWEFPKIGAHVIISFFEVELVNDESLSRPSLILDIIFLHIEITRDNGGTLGCMDDFNRL
jgi:hypothetical protein